MQRAFSLVELSIVLVILGLLTGGILAGQSLIRAAELRAVTSEYQRYLAAVQSFRNKYMALPGDMNNATRFWSRTVAAAHCVTNSSAAVASPGTCDGDGDGRIEFAGAVSQSAEMFQFWNQLAQAGLVEGSYSGLSGSGSTYDTDLTSTSPNSPKSKAANAGWTVADYSNYTGDALLFAYDYQNALFWGLEAVGSYTYYKALRPEEAWGIDTKLDDGMPANGTVISAYWDVCTNAANNADRAATYLLTDKTVQCSLVFAKAF